MSPDRRRSLQFYMILFCAFVLFAFYALGAALAPLVFAFILAYLLRPTISRLEALGFPRMASVVVVFLLSSAVLVFSVITVAPILLRELRDLVLSLPNQADILFSRADALALEYGYNLPIKREDVHNVVQQALSSVSFDLLQSATPLLTNTFSSLIQIVLVILNLALVPLFFAYFVHGFESIQSGLLSLVPLRYRPRAGRFVGRVKEILQGYLYGQLVVALVLAAYYGTGLWLVSLKYGTIIGIITGMLVVIPYVGFSLGLLTATIVGLTTFSTWPHFLAIFAVFGFGQILEGFLLTPWFVGQKVGLHPLTTIVALIVGGNLFGFAGLLVAVPSAAVVQEGLHLLRLEYRRSRFFLD